MMKFLLERNTLGGRLGSLVLSETFYETPMFFCHTQGGSIPHITSEVFQMIFGSGIPPPIQISIDSTHTFHEALEGSEMNISKFVGLENSPSLLTVSCPLNSKSKSGFNDVKGISIWTRKGRVYINPKTFNQITSYYKPDIVQALSDYDVNSEGDVPTSVKRIKKSIERNSNYLKEILESKHESTIFAAIEAGWFSSKEGEIEGYKALGKLNEIVQVGGYTIGGVKSLNGEDGKNYNQIGEILQKIPENKARFIGGPFTFDEILDLISKGVDLFDSSIVTKMTEDGIALIRSIEDDSGSGLKNGPPEELPVKEDNGNNDVEDGELLDLKDKKFASDFRPISSKCSCIACRKHTRSYLHHLFTTSELLFKVLLMSHNLHHFDRFFQSIRSKLKKEAGLDEKILIKKSVKA